jgi:hypothetical protein
MDLPDVDWFCKDCWMEDANSTLYNQGNIPLVYTKVLGDQGNQSKVSDLGVGGGRGADADHRSVIALGTWAGASP